MLEGAQPAQSATPAAVTPKKRGANAGSKKPKTAPSHPKVSDGAGGSSLQAIKKHIGAQYKVDVDKLWALVQTKGKGATLSFYLSASGQKSKELSAAEKQAKKESAVFANSVAQLRAS